MSGPIRKRRRHFSPRPPEWPLSLDGTSSSAAIPADRAWFDMTEKRCMADMPAVVRMEGNMEDAQKLSRRDFLRLSAVTAASAMLAACGGTATTPQGGATTAPGAAATTAPGAAATTGGAAPGGGAAA